MNTTGVKMKLIKQEGFGSLISDIVMYLHEEVLEQPPATYGEYAQMTQETIKQLLGKYRKQLKQQRNGNSNRNN